MLNPKQLRFCEEYVIDLNATQAAIRAGYSKKTAKEMGSENLTKPNIKSKVEELQEDIRRRSALTADMVVEELRDLAFYSIKDFINADNTIKKLSTLSRVKLKPVVGIKVKETITTVGKKIIKEVTTELKLSDKRASVVDLGRHTGIFKEDNEQIKPLPSNQLSDEQFNKLLAAARETKANSSK